MALTDLTLMLLLTSFIAKSCLLTVSDGLIKQDIYLTNNTQSTSTTEKNTEIFESNIWPEFPLHTLIENQIKDVPQGHIVESVNILEEQYRHPKFETIQTNDPKDQVEDVQSDDVVETDFMPEEQFRHAKFAIQMPNEIFDEDIEVHSKVLNESHLLTIFAFLLAILSVGCILAIISWRSYIKTHYGRRHRLVPSDEFNVSNDDRINF